MDRDKTSLLLVDKNSNYLLCMGMLLRRLDFTVQSSQTAEAALKTLVETPHSLVLTDIMLPGMSGIELLKVMRQDPRLNSTPVIIHSSELDPALERKCFSEGCTAYFRKPVETNILYRAIQTAVRTEPRRHIRIDTYLPVQVGDDAAKVEHLTTLSENGCYIQTHHPAPIHSEIPLTLHIREKKIKTKAVVLYTSAKQEVRQTMPGMGMKFKNMDLEAWTFIDTFIQDQLSRNLPYKDLVV